MTYSYNHRQLVHRLVFQLFFFVLTPTLLLSQSIDQKMRAAGLVDIQEIDPTIQVSLMYASTDNFVGVNMYGDLKKAYLLPHFAEKLRKAQRKLKSEKGEQYSLIIHDAARPLSVQRKMWNSVKGTPNSVYVAPPSNGGGRHNYGAAVDITIINLDTGEELDMGSPVDYFGERAHINIEASLVKRGLITQEAANNRAYLMQLMNSQDLRAIRKEWWHFQERNSISYVRKTYQLLDF